MQATKSRLMERVMAVDVNRDGKLDLDEFTMLFDEEQNKIDTARRANQKFAELDTDQSGYLENGESIRT